MNKIFRRISITILVIWMSLGNLLIQPALAINYSHSHSHAHSPNHFHSPSHPRTGGRISGGSFKPKTNSHLYHHENHTRVTSTKNNISKFPTNTVTRTGGRISGNLFHEAKAKASKRSTIYHDHTVAAPNRKRVSLHHDRITTKPIRVSPEIEIPSGVRLTPRYTHRFRVHRPFYGIIATHPDYYHGDQIVIAHHNPIWGIVVNFLILFLLVAVILFLFRRG